MYYFYTYQTPCFFSFVFQICQNQLWVPNNLFLQILYQSSGMIDFGEKKKDFLLSLLCHAVYFAYSNTLLCGREKNVWICRSKWRVAPNLESSNQVYWNWAIESRETSVCRKTHLKHSGMLVRQFFCFCFCFRDYLKIICYLGACKNRLQHQSQLYYL